MAKKTLSEISQKIRDGEVEIDTSNDPWITLRKGGMFSIVLQPDDVDAIVTMESGDFDQIVEETGRKWLVRNTAGSLSFRSHGVGHLTVSHRDFVEAVENALSERLDK